MMFHAVPINRDWVTRQLNLIITHTCRLTPHKGAARAARFQSIEYPDTVYCFIVLMKTLAVGKAYMKSSTIGTNIVLDSSEKNQKKKR